MIEFGNVEYNWLATKAVEDDRGYSALGQTVTYNRELLIEAVKDLEEADARFMGVEEPENIDDYKDDIIDILKTIDDDEVEFLTYN